MAFLGCTGMAIENKVCSITYFSIQLVIIFAEIAIGAYWLVRTNDLQSLVVTDQSFAAYDMSKNVHWTIMQMEMVCCGSRGPYDYPKHNLTVPKECCISEPSISTFHLLASVYDQKCEAAYVIKGACHDVIVDSLNRERGVVAAFTFGGAVIKLAMLLASFLIPFEEIVEEIGWSPVGSFEWNPNKEQVSATE